MLKRTFLIVSLLLAACAFMPATASDIEPSYAVVGGVAEPLTDPVELEALAVVDRQVSVTGEDHATLLNAANDFQGWEKVTEQLKPAHRYRSGPFEVGWRA